MTADSQNSTTEAVVTESEIPTIDWAIRTLRVIADKGRAGLGDSYPEILSVIGGLKNFAQSRQASAQGGERVEHPPLKYQYDSKMLKWHSLSSDCHSCSGPCLHRQAAIDALCATPPATSGAINFPWPWATEADLLRDAITYLGHQPRIAKAMGLLLQRAEGGPVKCPDCDGSGVDGDCGPDGQAIDVACGACNGTGSATSGMKESLDADIVGAAHLVCDDFGIPPGNLMGRLSVLHVRAPNQDSLVGDAERWKWLCDSGETEAGKYVVMAYLAGDTLTNEVHDYKSVADAAIRAGRKGAGQ